MYRYKINYNTLFQFTHPVWGATDGASDLGSKSFVSIHAPRVGCDPSAPLSA